MGVFFKHFPYEYQVLFMKTLFKHLFFISLLCSTQCNATLLEDFPSDFGEVVVDTLKASARLADSGAATELAWVREILNDESITFTQKYDYTNDEEKMTEWQSIPDDSTLYYTDLLDSTDYFILKFGVDKKSGAPSHYLFENLNNLKYAVIDLSDIAKDHAKPSKFEITKLSHFGEYSEPGTTVIPEPANTLLMSLGIFLIGLRRYLAT